MKALPLLVISMLALTGLALVPGAAATDPCPDKTLVIGQYERHTVDVDGDCSVDIILNEGVICVGGNVVTNEATVGPVHVTWYGCGGGPQPQPLHPGVGIQHQDVFLPQLMGCLWTGSYKVLVDTPFVTVWHYTCDPET